MYTQNPIGAKYLDTTASSRMSPFYQNGSVAFSLPLFTNPYKSVVFIYDGPKYKIRLKSRIAGKIYRIPYTSTEPNTLCTTFNTRPVEILVPPSLILREKLI